MRRNIGLIITAAGVALAAAACQQGGGAGARSAQEQQAASQYTAEQKQEFAALVDSTLTDASEVAGKVESGLKSGSVKEFTREKLNAFENQIARLKTQDEELEAATTNYDSVRKETQSALQDMEANHYAASALFPDQRQQAEQHVSGSLAELREKIDSLQAASADASPDARQEINDTVAQLEQSHTDAAQTLVELKKSSGDQWAKLRGDLDDKLEKTRDTYWQARRKAVPPSAG